MSAQQRSLPRHLTGAALLVLCFVSAGVQADALQLPAVKSTAQTELLQEAGAQYQRYIAAPDSFFNVDASKKTEWPCKVSAAQLEQLTGISDYAAGGAAGYGHRFSDIAIHPIAAGCKQGKLDGQVELVYEAVRKAWGPAYQNSAQEIARVVATFANGKLVHRTELRKSTDLAQSAVGSTPGASSIASSAEWPAGAFITSATALVSGDGQKYFLKQPVKTPHGTRLQKTFFFGTKLVSVEHSDAKGKPDGIAVSYKAGEEKKDCFRQGKPTDLKACGA